MPEDGAIALVILALFVSACGWGHWLHWRSGMHQPWDWVTAIISAISAIGGVMSAESLANSTKRLLDSEVKEQVLSQIFASFPPRTALVLAKGNDLLYQEWSASFENLYGISPSAGDSHYGLFPGLKEGRPDWVALHQATLWQGEEFTQDDPIAYPKPCGEEGWLTFSLSAVPDIAALPGEPPYQALMIWKDVSQTQELRRQVDELVYRDGLTGLYNKRFFDECLGRFFVEQARDPGPISLLMIDLDEFKSVNDRFGHQAGDALLREAADRICRNSRGGDIEVRWAGDELAVIVRADAVGALKAANRLHTVMTTEPVVYRGASINLRCSIGVATAYSGSPEDLLSAADTALYAAKAAGRNRVHGGAAAEARIALEIEVANAVHQKQIVPYFQPIIDLRSGALVGAEALARWEHDGIVDFPAKFMQIIEDSPALCRQFCDMQLRHVCRQAKLWEDRWDGWISFNLSQESLKRDDPAGWLHSIFAEANIPSHLIAVEATEQLQTAGQELRQNLALLDASFQKLMQSDLSILLDDFAGPGGGSGTQLSWMIMALAPGANSRLLVKLDRAIVAGIHKNDSLRHLTKGLVSTFHSLGFLVIAEGIEDAAEADCLREMDCDLAQGWYWGKAVASQEFEQLHLDG